MKIPRLHSKGTRIFFFWVGIFATFLYRAIVIINNYNKFWAQMFWYIGTIGFIVYFAHRYQISQNRAKLIKNFKLEEKIKYLKELTSEEKEAMEYVFITLQSSKEKINSIFIFVSSAIALILGFYLDFMRK